MVTQQYSCASVGCFNRCTADGKVKTRNGSASLSASPGGQPRYGSCAFMHSRRAVPMPMIARSGISAKESGTIQAMRKYISSSQLAQGGAGRFAPLQSVYTVYKGWHHTVPCILLHEDLVGTWNNVRDVL